MISHYFPVNYQPVQMPQQLPQPLPQNINRVYFVGSGQEATEWFVARGETAYLFDRAGETMYVKSVADNGMVSIDSYKKESGAVTNNPYVTREEFEERIAALNTKPQKKSKEKTEDAETE